MEDEIDLVSLYYHFTNGMKPEQSKGEANKIEQSETDESWRVGPTPCLLLAFGELAGANAGELVLVV